MVGERRDFRGREVAKVQQVGGVRCILGGK